MLPKYQIAKEGLDFDLESYSSNEDLMARSHRESQL